VERQEGVLPPGSRVAEHFTVARVLGGGTMSTVYEARANGASGARFAIKTLVVPAGAQDGDERRARFLREARVCGSLVHPNVVPIVSSGFDAERGTPYIVMPLLEGEDLAKVLDRVGALEPEVAVALFVQASAGLAAAHAKGVVHRDIKPSNLFLERQGERMVVRVTDFGLAKTYPGGEDATATSSSRRGLTATGRFMGTPRYVSPEQAVSAKHVDERSDVYSLAMSLYHALAGAPAFSYVASFMGLVLEITSRDAPHIQDAAPWVPASIARVIHAAVLRDPSARCPSAVEFGLALETAAGLDVSHRPIGADALGPGRAWARRASDPRHGREGSAHEPDVAPRAGLVSSWDDILRT
jgi:serine/threonine-protein kinase